MTLLDFQDGAADALPVLDIGSASPRDDILAARRDLLVKEGRDRPIERLASFLLYLSRDNVHSGGDGYVIAGDLRCDIVAELLHFTIDQLELYLIALQRLGLILPRDDGALKLTDIEALEAVATTGSIKSEIPILHSNTLVASND